MVIDIYDRADRSVENAEAKYIFLSWARNEVAIYDRSASRNDIKNGDRQYLLQKWDIF